MRVNLAAQQLKLADAYLKVNKDEDAKKVIEPLLAEYQKNNQDKEKSNDK